MTARDTILAELECGFVWGIRERAVLADRLVRRLTEEGHLPAPAYDDAVAESEALIALLQAEHATNARLRSALKDLYLWSSASWHPGSNVEEVLQGLRESEARAEELLATENTVSAVLSPVSGPSGSSTPEEPLDDTEAPEA